MSVSWSSLRTYRILNSQCCAGKVMPQTSLQFLGLKNIDLDDDTGPKMIPGPIGTLYLNGYIQCQKYFMF